MNNISEDLMMNAAYLYDQKAEIMEHSEIIDAFKESIKDKITEEEMAFLEILMDMTAWKSNIDGMVTAYHTVHTEVFHNDITKEEVKANMDVIISKTLNEYENKQKRNNITVIK